jgi:hypothetical protein
LLLLPLEITLLLIVLLLVIALLISSRWRRRGTRLVSGPLIVAPLIAIATDIIWPGRFADDVTDGAWCEMRSRGALN